MRQMFIALLLVVTMAVPAHAATKTVTASGFSFSPSTAGGPAGTSVRWEKGMGTHNVRSTAGMFYSGSAADTAWPYVRTFSAGTFRYYCEVHGTGMNGSVTVVSGRTYGFRAKSLKSGSGSGYSPVRNFTP